MTHVTIPWSRMTQMTLVGGLAFWAANFAISLTPVAAAYRTALSISYWPMTLAALVGGLLIAAGVSGLLQAFRDHLPGDHPILKATLLSLAIMSLIEAFSIAVDVDHLSLYHVIGAVINVPRFVALGLAVGWSAGRPEMGAVRSVRPSDSCHVER